MNDNSTASPVQAPVAASLAALQDEGLAQWSSVDNWPLSDVLNKLADATEHLLRDHNCDEHGWETFKYAALAARRHVALIVAAKPSGAREAVNKAATEIATRYTTEGAGYADRLYQLAYAIEQAVTTHVNQRYREGVKAASREDFLSFVQKVAGLGCSRTMAKEGDVCGFYERDIKDFCAACHAETFLDDEGQQLQTAALLQESE